jgi:hypothetical protein
VGKSYTVRITHLYWLLNLKDQNICMFLQQSTTPTVYNQKQLEYVKTVTQVYFCPARVIYRGVFTAS